MKLEIKNLTKYFDDKCIFDSFSYSFSETGIYALVGESGIGKTTLLRIIASLDNSYREGEIVGGGVKNVSFAFQEYRLFPELSALENIIFTISDKKSEAVCEQAKKMLFRLGFNDTDMDLLPEELSGGMKQRVSLARAFLKEAPIILLDEPTKELDEKNTMIVKQIISELAKTKLVIMVTHNPDDIVDLCATKIQL